MIRILISWFVMVAVLVSALPLDVPIVHSADIEGYAHWEDPCDHEPLHGDENPCEPCSDGCVCPCCPSILTFALPEPTNTLAQQDQRRGYSTFTDGLNPREHVFRIFHPPKSG